MQQYKYTKEQTLIACDYGRKYFKSVFPHLTVDKYNPQSVDSIFHNERRRSLNINYYNGKYLFKDFAGQGYKGDVFTFVACQHHLDIKKDFGRILRIINEAVEKMPSEEMWDDQESEDRFLPLPNEGKELSYYPDSTCHSWFKEKHPGLFDDGRVFDIFKIKLIDEARFYDHDGQYTELKSNIEAAEVYFSFSGDDDDVELIYNPDKDDLYYASTEAKGLRTFAFGWEETEKYLADDCPEANRNLVITNSVINVLLLRMMDAPVVGWFGVRNDDFLYKDLFSRFQNHLFCCDQTGWSKRMGKAIADDCLAEYIDFTTNPALSGCLSLKDCFLDDAKEAALMDEVFDRFIFVEAA